MSSNLLKLDPFAAAIARKEREERERQEAERGERQSVESSQPVSSGQPPESNQPERLPAIGQKSSQPLESSQPAENLVSSNHKPLESSQPKIAWQPLESSQPLETPLNLLSALPDAKGHLETPYQLLDHLFRHLTPPQQAVYIQLYRLSWGFKKEKCFISNPGLAGRACLSVSAVKENVNKLVQKGLIKKTGNIQGFGKNQGIEYLVYAPSWQLARNSQPRRSSQPIESSQPRSASNKEIDLKEKEKGEAVACQDCQGTGFWYPEGTGKGVARCTHKRFQAMVNIQEE
jgi:hypothetical protein